MLSTSSIEYPDMHGLTILPTRKLTSYFLLILNNPSVWDDICVMEMSCIV